MVEILDNFDADQIELETSYSLIPDGTRALAMLTSSELKPNKSNTGQNLVLGFQIVDGEFTGRRIFETLVWEHDTSETSVKINRAKFASLCLALGNSRPKDTEELHDKPFNCEIGIRKGTQGYSDQNFIKKYLASESEPKKKIVSEDW